MNLFNDFKIINNGTGLNQTNNQQIRTAPQNQELQVTETGVLAPIFPEVEGYARVGKFVPQGTVGVSDIENWITFYSNVEVLDLRFCDFLFVSPAHLTYLAYHFLGAQIDGLVLPSLCFEGSNWMGKKLDVHSVSALMDLYQCNEVRIDYRNGLSESDLGQLMRQYSNVEFVVPSLKQIKLRLPSLENLPRYCRMLSNTDALFSLTLSVADLDDDCIDIVALLDQVPTLKILKLVPTKQVSSRFVRQKTLNQFVKRLPFLEVLQLPNRSVMPQVRRISEMAIERHFWSESDCLVWPSCDFSQEATNTRQNISDIGSLVRNTDSVNLADIGPKLSGWAFSEELMNKHSDDLDRLVETALTAARCCGNAVFQDVWIGALVLSCRYSNVSVPRFEDNYLPEKWKRPLDRKTTGLSQITMVQRLLAGSSLQNKQSVDEMAFEIVTKAIGSSDPFWLCALKWIRRFFPGEMLEGIAGNIQSSPKLFSQDLATGKLLSSVAAFLVCPTLDRVYRIELALSEKLDENRVSAFIRNTNSALRECRNDAVGYSVLGLVMSRNREYSPFSNQYIHFGFRLNPESEVLTFCGFRASRNIKVAREYHARLMPSLGDDGRFLFSSMGLFSRLGDFKFAEMCGKKVLELGPMNPVFYIETIKVLVTSGDIFEAKKVQELALEHVVESGKGAILDWAKPLTDLFNFCVNFETLTAQGNKTKFDFEAGLLFCFVRLDLLLADLPGGTPVTELAFRTEIGSCLTSQRDSNQENRVFELLCKTVQSVSGESIRRKNSQFYRLYLMIADYVD